MKGMRRYGWMRPRLVKIPGFMDGAWSFNAEDSVSEKGKKELCRWIRIEDIYP